jgi:hypothetical protein
MRWAIGPTITISSTSQASPNDPAVVIIIIIIGGANSIGHGLRIIAQVMDGGSNGDKSAISEGGGSAVCEL